MPSTNGVLENNSIAVPPGTSKQSFEPEDNVFPASTEIAIWNL
jgi:hypothetical protein